MTPTISTESLPIYEIFNPFNRGVRELRRLVRRHMALTKTKWFRPNQADRDQQLDLEGRVKTLKGELRMLGKNSPAYWGVLRVLQRMGKHLNYTGRVLKIQVYLRKK